MVKKKILIIPVLVLMFASISGIFYIFYQMNNSNKYLTGDVYLALTNDSYLIMNMDSDGATYYRQYLNTNEVVTLGKIDTFYMQTKENSIFDDSIYFPVALIDGGVALYKIDLKTNELKALSFDSACAADAYTFICNDSIALAKMAFDGDNIYSYIDLYNGQDFKPNTSIKETLNSDKMTGEIILKACNSNGLTYILKDIGQGVSRESITKIEVFDANFYRVSSIDLTNISDNIMGSRIYLMEVLGDYIYMSNCSNYSVFGKIIDGNIVPLIQKRNLELANNKAQDGKIILYTRSGNDMFIVDQGTGQINQIDVNRKDDTTIRCVLANGSDIIIAYNTEAGIDYIYSSSITKLEDKGTVFLS